MDLHEAQKGGGAPIGSPHEINNLKQQLQDTKKKLEAAEKQVDEKTQIVNDLENKLKVDMINSSASLEGQCLLLLCNLYLWLTLHGNLLISLILCFQFSSPKQ